MEIVQPLQIQVLDRELEARWESTYSFRACRLRGSFDEAGKRSVCARGGEPGALAVTGQLEASVHTVQVCEP